MEQNIEEQPIMVTVRCLVYNHERFLRQCLDGFVMQETNFPFEVIVHDDASTDGSAKIILEYLGEISSSYAFCPQDVWCHHLQLHQRS